MSLVCYWQSSLSWKGSIMLLLCFSNNYQFQLAWSFLIHWSFWKCFVPRQFHTHFISLNRLTPLFFYFVAFFTGLRSGVYWSQTWFTGSAAQTTLSSQGERKGPMTHYCFAPMTLTVRARAKRMSLCNEMAHSCSRWSLSAYINGAEKRWLWCLLNRFRWE